jgi:hypothetical protein
MGTANSGEVDQGYPFLAAVEAWTRLSEFKQKARTYRPKRKRTGFAGFQL